MHRLRQLNVGLKLLIPSQSQVCFVFCSNFIICDILSIRCFTLYAPMCSLADFYTETVTLNISTSMGLTRIECRAFLLEISEVPCCNNSNHNSLCQPDTGIARVVVDILGPSDPTVSTLCKPGVSLHPLNDECPLNGQPKYCHLDGANVTQTGDLKMFYISGTQPGVLVSFVTL